MAHHRCTGCKEESYPRHKYKGGVYCDHCIKFIRGGRVGHGGISGWFGGLWDRLVDFVVTKVFRKESPKQAERVKERQVISLMKQMEHKARSIPTNPQGLNPQKR